MVLRECMPGPNLPIDTPLLYFLKLIAIYYGSTNGMGDVLYLSTGPLLGGQVAGDLPV